MQIQWQEKYQHYKQRSVSFLKYRASKLLVQNMDTWAVLSALRPFSPSLSALSEPKCKHSLHLFAILLGSCADNFFAFRSITISCIAIFRLDLNSSSIKYGHRHSFNTIPSNFNAKGSLWGFGAGSRFELPTFGLWAQRATNCATPHMAELFSAVKRFYDKSCLLATVVL